MRRDPGHRLVWLFGPGVDEHAHAAMVASGADVLIQDLEDFTPPPLRPQARALAAQSYRRWRDAGRTVCVRINLLADDGPRDLEAVMPHRPDIIAYPKAEAPQDLVALHERLARLEAQHGIELGSTEILPVCETALGVVRVRELAAATPRIRCALLGAEDLAADLHAERGPDALELDHARRRFVLECRAAHIEPVDAPYTYSDIDGAVAEARYARRLGYRCKSLVLPQMVSAVRAAMRPSDDAIGHAREIVVAFEQARGRGEERALVRGQWVEVPTYLNARRLLARAQELAAIG
jgi:citrate lyase subunit beta / citryl-CoA lyase